MRYLVRPVHYREEDGAKPVLLLIFDLDEPHFTPRTTDGWPQLEPHWVFRQPVWGRPPLPRFFETRGIALSEVFVQADAVVTREEGRRLSAKAGLEGIPPPIRYPPKRVPYQMLPRSAVGGPWKTTPPRV